MVEQNTEARVPCMFGHYLEAGSSNNGRGYDKWYLGVTSLHISSKSLCRMFNTAPKCQEDGFRKQLCWDTVLLSKRGTFFNFACTPFWSIMNRTSEFSCNGSVQSSRERCSTTEGMTQLDVNLTSPAQYWLLAIQIDKNSALGRFGEHKASLKMPLVCLFLYSLNVWGRYEGPPSLA